MWLRKTEGFKKNFEFNETILFENKDNELN